MLLEVLQFFLILLGVLSCYFLEHLDLLDDLRVLLALLEVPEPLIRLPPAAVLPLRGFVLCALGLWLFFGRVFAVIERVGGLAFCEVETADLAVA
jgi:hypothetical protein